jgi:endonuclease/exonuclease/phosphatase family metal-dependent hydrolase
MKRSLAVGVLILVAGVLIARSPAPVPNPVETEPADISVASLNLAKEQDCDTVMRDLRKAPRLLQADILLLQEVVERKGQPSIAHQVASHLGYSVAYSAEMTDVEDRGLAVLSRYPINDTRVQPLRRYDLRFHSRNRFFIGTTVHAPSGAISVWNVHLDTRLNAEERLSQLTPLLKATESGAGARLIGGDFNTNDFYWIGNVLPFPAGKSHSAVLRKAMQRFGFESPFSDRIVTHPVANRHLDWIYTSGLKPINSSVESIPFSDHHAIWVSLKVATDRD